MVDRKTRLIVEAEGRGLDKLKRGLLGTQSAVEGVGKASSHIATLGDNIVKTAKDMDAATKAAEKHERATRRLTQETEKANRMKERESRKPMRDHSGRFISGSQNYTQAQRQEVQRRQNMRGFTMGALQGVGMGEYFPEKGFSANVAGRFVGSGVRKAGQGVGSALFGGVGGMAQALSGIPVVGGLMAGQLNNLMGAAGSGLSAYQQESQLLGNVDLAAFANSKKRNTRSALKGVNTLKQTKVGAGFAANAMYGQTLRSASDLEAMAAIRGEGSIPTGYDGDMVGSYAASGAANPFSGIAGGPNNSGAIDAGKRVLANEAASKAKKQHLAQGQRSRRGARNRAANKTREAFLNLSQFNDDNYATNLGMSNADVRSFIGQMSQAEGGALSNLTGDGAGTKIAMSLSKLGVDAGTSGSIMRGARLGGGNGADALMQVMNSGLKLNLAGSDLLKYMKDSAASLSDIETTGIKFNAKGFGDTASTLGGTFGSERGIAMAQGLRSSGRRMADSGPSTGIDMMALQTLYGYDPSKGDASFYAAQSRAQSSTIQKGGLKTFMGRLMEGEGLTAESKARRLTAGLKGQGVSIGMQESLQIAQTGFSGFMTEGGSIDRGSLNKSAASLQSSGEKMRAVNANRTEAAGKRILGTVQTLEAGQTKMMLEWSKQSVALQGMAKSVSDAAVGVTQNAQEFISDLQSFLSMEMNKRKTEAAKGIN